MQRLSTRETNCTIHWSEIYQVDSVIPLLNNWGQKFSSVCGTGYIRELQQRRWRRQPGRQKSNRFITQNNNFAHASCFFVHFFTVLARLRLIASFMEYVNKRQQISFSFSKLECGPQEINSKEIRQHLPFSANWNKRDKD